MVRGYRFNEYIIYLSTIRVFIFGSFLNFSPRFQREALSWFDRVTSNSFYVSHDYITHLAPWRFVKHLANRTFPPSPFLQAVRKFGYFMMSEYERFCHKIVFTLMPCLTITLIFAFRGCLLIPSLYRRHRHQSSWAIME